jgi:hypothetical protein
MKHTVQLASEFGPRLSDGEKAYSFRVQSLDRYVDLCEEITLDFTGIRVANSSFINALVSGLIADHGQVVVDKLVFRGCLPTVRVLVQAAVDLGMIKHAELMAANS